jgi:hypothetical protein
MQASLADTELVLKWARRFIQVYPEPDFTVRQGDSVYLQRWYVIPRNDVRNIYLHRFLMSDDARAMHDHRGDNTSWILDGQYREHSGFYRNDGTIFHESPVVRKAGDIVERKGSDLHRVELLTDTVLSLFFVGPCTREWGFACPQGWVPQQEYIEKGGCTDDRRDC